MSRVIDNRKSRFSGGLIFNAIVATVRNRTGLDYDTVFRQALANNGDLMSDSIDPTDHTQAFTRLTNRLESSGIGAVASVNLAADEVGKISNRFYPFLCTVPTALQWDVLTRTALQLEKTGFVDRMLNRFMKDPKVGAADWRAANARASDVLAALEYRAENGRDYGTNEEFKNLTAENKVKLFASFVKQIMRTENLSREDAFNHLKETQPIFWTNAILSFDSEK